MNKSIKRVINNGNNYFTEESETNSVCSPPFDKILGKIKIRLILLFVYFVGEVRKIGKK